MKSSNIQSHDQERIENRDRERTAAKPERRRQVKSGVRAGVAYEGYQPEY